MSRFTIVSLTLSLFLIPLSSISTLAAPNPSTEEIVECEILIVGGGLAGSAAATEAILAGRTVCLTEITDWVGGQISSQGTSALDEAKKQRSLLFFPRGYKQLRQNIQQYYGKLNPGECWVSESCFMPKDAHNLLWDMLQKAAKRGKGSLKWFPRTIVKELNISDDGKIIEEVIAIQHAPAANTPPLNTEPLSQIIEDIYSYENSSRLTKKIIRFSPVGEGVGSVGSVGSVGRGGEGENSQQPTANSQQPDWFVIEATETGEIVALADVPYRLGLDPLSYSNPSSPTSTGDPYCTQGFTYTFALERTEEPQPQQMPSFYPRYQPYYGYDPNPNKANFDFVFTYRRISSPTSGEKSGFRGIGFTTPTPGDISMQNWVWGNDYRPGTVEDNLIYSRSQLEQLGQLDRGGWMGGLRPEALRKGEELALGFYYWLVAGTTDSQLGEGIKTIAPNHRFLSGLDSPMGTVHGLSKYPYIREARRIIGRPSLTYPNGFSVDEIDISAKNYRDEYYRKNLSPRMYRNLWKALAGLEMPKVIAGEISVEDIKKRTRSTIYPDSVGIAHYAIDFHPCMTFSPPEKPGNKEREGVRRGQGSSYPAQIPLRAIIPQKIDNLLVAGKTMAASNIAAAAYRVHSFEWSSGAAAGTTAVFALEEGIFPYQLVDDLPRQEPKLRQLRRRLEKNGNPTSFPDTSIFNLDWDDWRVW